MMDIKTKHVHFAGTGNLPALLEMLKDKTSTIVTSSELVIMFRAKLPKHNVMEYTVDSMCDEKEKRILVMPWNDNINYHMLYENFEVWTFAVEKCKAGLHALCSEPCTIVHCKDSEISGVTTYRKD